MSDLILYAPKQNATGQRLFHVLRASLGQDGLKTFANIHDFAAHLRRPLPGQTIVVAVAEGRAELYRLLILGTLLHCVNLILILSPSDPETISLGHRLRPRFLALAEWELWEVLAVLFKMLAKQKENTDERSNYRPAQGAI